MWTILLTQREARELCSIYVKALILLVIFVHPFLKTGVQASGSGDKGASCRLDEDCNKNQSLQCVADRCACRGFFTWVAEANSCMVMEDGHCRTNGVPCVPDSSCLYGTCECNDNYLRNGFGRCELSYGNFCSESEPCARRYSLHCAQNPEGQRTCQCLGEGEDMIWDDLKRKCVSLASGSCDTREDERFGKDDQQECIQNAECVAPGFCRCKPGFTQTPGGTCKLQYDQPCSASPGQNDCNELEFLVCRDGRCACEFYGQMIYDPEIRQCRHLVGESCSANVSRDRESGKMTTKCVEDAYCKPRAGSHRGTCECIPGFSTTMERTCSRYNKGYGYQCSAAVDCDRKRFLECVPDEEEGGRCKCFDNKMFWDGSRCRVHPGQLCTQNPNCAENSYCEGTWCTCNTGYVIVDSNCVKSNKNGGPHIPIAPAPRMMSSTPRSTWQSRHSEYSFGDNCGQYYEQDSLSGKMCECQLKVGTHTWVQEKGACLALVGTPCAEHSECIPDAVCDYYLKMCQCVPGAHTTMDKTCHRHQRLRDCTEISHTLQSVSASGRSNYFGSGVVLLVITATVILSQYFLLKV